jgi:hypothetical protein
MQFLAGSGYYDKGIGATYDPDDKNQEDGLMEAIANYTMDQYSKGSGNQITDVKTKVDKSIVKGDDDNTSTKLNHTKFINTLGGIEGGLEIVETPSGLPPKIGTQAQKDAKKGNVYQNQVEFNKDGSKNPDFEKIYRFDGEKYVELDPENGDSIYQDKLKVQKLAEIRKYLENKENVFRGNNAEVQASDSLDNPDPNKIYRKGGTDANPTFIEIDTDDLFSLDVLGDLNKMEVALNKALGINPI